MNLFRENLAQATRRLRRDLGRAEAHRLVYQAWHEFRFSGHRLDRGFWQALALVLAAPRQ
jgi:hypothetical protein